MLRASVEPRASAWIAKKFGAVLKDQAGMLVTRPESRELGEELFRALAQMSEAGLQWRESLTAAGSGSGTAEVPESAGVEVSGSASSFLDGRTPGGRQFTTAGAAERMGVSDRYVRELCVRDRLPAALVGGRWVVDAVAVEAWCEAKEVHRG